MHVGLVNPRTWDQIDSVHLDHPSRVAGSRKDISEKEKGIGVGPRGNRTCWTPNDTDRCEELPGMNVKAYSESRLPQPARHAAFRGAVPELGPR